MASVAVRSLGRSRHMGHPVEWSDILVRPSDPAPGDLPGADPAVAKAPFLRRQRPGAFRGGPWAAPRQTTMSTVASAPPPGSTRRMDTASACSSVMRLNRKSLAFCGWSAR